MSAVRRFHPGSVSYQGAVATAYRSGRALSNEAAAAWRQVWAPFITGRPTILDLGAGTGRFWPLLTSFPTTWVVGVDPSLDMLRVATDASVDRCRGVVGQAEAIPLRSRSCEVAWMSQSLHHVSDKSRCADELARVLRPSSPVLVRGTFSDRLDGFPTLFHFFPRARDICSDLPTVASVVAAFGSAGLTLEDCRSIAQQTCGSLQAFLQRSRQRADSALALMTDDEFSSGLERLEDAVGADPDLSPVIEELTLLVFRTPRA